jgi:fibronectin type 3 domain-containing protein
LSNDIIYDMAERYDMYVDAGATYVDVVTFRDSAGALVNLTGYTAALKIRPTVESSTTTLSLTQASGLTLGGAAGTVTITLTAANTTTLASGNYVYDLKVTSAGGVATRLVEGDVIVSAEVSRA